MTPHGLDNDELTVLQLIAGIVLGLILVALVATAILR